MDMINPSMFGVFSDKREALEAFKAIGPAPAILRSIVRDERRLWLLFSPPSVAYRHETANIDEYGVHMAKVYGVATSAKTRRKI